MRPVSQSGLDHYRRLVRPLAPTVSSLSSRSTTGTSPRRSKPKAVGRTGKRQDGSRSTRDLVAGALGDNVDLWLTLNEPWVAAFAGYARGDHARGRRNLGASVLAAHHLLLGHGLAARAIAETVGRSAQIGIALNLRPGDPRVNDRRGRGRHATRGRAPRTAGSSTRSFAAPTPRGCSKSTCASLGTTSCEPVTSRRSTADLDFLGVNYYTAAKWPRPLLRIAPTGPRDPIHSLARGRRRAAA